MPPFKVTIVYLDNDVKDVARFKRLIESQPQISVFEPEVVHVSRLNQARQWLNEHSLEFETSDSVVICCFDPSAGGIDPQASHLAVDALAGTGLPKDCIIALPDPSQAALVWEVLGSKLDNSQIINKQDALTRINGSYNGAAKALAEILGAALAKRTSNGERALQFSVMKLEGEFQLLKSEIDRRIGSLDYKLEDRILKSLSTKIEHIQEKLNVIEHTLFPAQDLTGNPSVITLLTSLQQQAAANAKDINKLDKDIGSLADLCRSRRQTDNQSVEALQADIEGIFDQLQDLASATQQRHELAIKKADFLYGTGGRIILAVALLILGVIATFVAPDLIELIGDVLE